MFVQDPLLQITRYYHNQPLLELVTSSQHFTIPPLGKPFEFHIYLSVLLYLTSSHALHGLLLVTGLDEANTNLRCSSALTRITRYARLITSYYYMSS